MKATIRSFYLAPVIGLALTFCVPFVYFMVQVCGKQPGMFSAENRKWSITVIVAFIIEVAVLCYMGWEAHKIRKQVTEATYSSIIRGLQAVGSRGQSFMQSLADPNADLKVDLTVNSAPYNVKDFSSTIKDCIVCCEPFLKGAKIVRMPCNPDKHFFH